MSTRKKEERRGEKIFTEIMAEFDKNINLHIQEAKLGRIKAKGPTSKHNKLNAERQKENLESSKGKITSYIQQNPSKINS